MLYACNVLRFTTNMALVYLFTEWASQFVLAAHATTELTEGMGIQASRVNGLLQASMQMGMGAGGITLGFILAPRFEKTVFVVLPLLGAISIACIPFLTHINPSMARWLVMGASMLSGIGFGAVIPVSISLAQRLLPHRTSLVSGLMLGGAWMLSFLGPIGAEVVQNGLSAKPELPDMVTRLVSMLPTELSTKLMEGMGLDAAFMVTACVLALAGMIAFFLPHALIVEIDR